MTQSLDSYPDFMDNHELTIESMVQKQALRLSDEGSGLIMRFFALDATAPLHDKLQLWEEAKQFRAEVEALAEFQSGSAA
jgi:hypothetical protein